VWRVDAVAGSRQGVVIQVGFGETLITLQRKNSNDMKLNTEPQLCTVTMHLKICV
jgi:hypothetical protein